jgi:hypothetical protein
VKHPATRSTGLRVNGDAEVPRAAIFPMHLVIVSGIVLRLLGVRGCYAS